MCVYLVLTSMRGDATKALSRDDPLSPDVRQHPPLISGQEIEVLQYMYR